MLRPAELGDPQEQLRADSGEQPQQSQEIDRQSLRNGSQTRDAGLARANPS
jgi:hypothetical protein